MKKTIKIGEQWYSYDCPSPQESNGSNLLRILRKLLTGFLRRMEIVLFFTLITLLCLFFIDDARYLLLRQLTTSLHRDIATAVPLEDYQ